MSSAEQPRKIIVDETLTITHLINERHADLEVLGASVEADADRLLVAGDNIAAIHLYETLDPKTRPLREKLSFAMWAQGISEAWDALTLDFASTSLDGIVMQIRAFGGVMHSADVDDSWLAVLVDTILARDDIKPREPLLAVTIFLAASMSRNRFSEALYPESCAKAASELKRMNSKFSDCMEAFTLANRARFQPPANAELYEVVKRLDPSTCPVLGFGFSAAVTAKNKEVAKAFARELCHRYPDHPRLLHTIAIAAIQARDPSIIEEAPEVLRQGCWVIPEVQLLVALDKKDGPAVVKAIEKLPAGSEPRLSSEDAILEPFLRLPWLNWNLGTWSIFPSLLGDWCSELVAVMPAGELRDNVLMECTFLGEAELEQLTPAICELFDRKPTSDVFYLLPDGLPLDRVSPNAVAQHILDAATEDEPYCSLVDPEFNPDLKPLFSLGVIDHLLSKVQELPQERRADCLRVLTAWGLVQRPERHVKFTFEQRLDGNGLPTGMLDHLEAIRLTIQSATGEQAVFIQAMLEDLSVQAKRSTTVAAEESEVVQAINEVIGLKSRSLTEVGHKRIGDLVNRYGAAKLLSGLRALIKNSDLDQKEGLIDILSKHMAKEQGSLAGRRSYLAGILRKRLVNLRSNWLDQQVSECIKLGIDVEQMIELAKTVTTWDDWTVGLGQLRPY